MSRGIPITAERAIAAGFRLTRFERTYMSIKGTASGIRMRASTAKLRKALRDQMLTPAQRHDCWRVLHHRRHANTRLSRERLANWHRDQRRAGYEVGGLL